MTHENLSNEDLENICRVCLQRSENRIDLFSSTAGYSMISEAVMECAPIQISYDDNLPHSICQSCIIQLDIAYRFRVLCVQSDITLRQLVSQLDNEFKNETDEFKDSGSVNYNGTEIENEIKEEVATIDSDDDVKSLDDFFNDTNDEQNIKIETVKKVHEYTCVKCSTKFKRKYHLQRHQKRCLSGKIVRRKKMMVKDESDGALKDEDVKPIKANIKPYATFKDNIILDENGRYSCGICKKTYKSKYHTARHAIVHSDIRYRCPHCDKCFVRPNSLSEHINVHTGKRSYNCEFCGKIFRTDSALNTHRRIHLGVRPYKCQVCERSFTQNKTLKNHMRTHTGERPFVCETCGRSFNRKHILKTHTMIHTGERPFKCEICARTFICKQHLQLHLIKHTGEPPSSFRCAVCDKKFTTNLLKQKHEVEEHNLLCTN